MYKVIEYKVELPESKIHNLLMSTEDYLVALTFCYHYNQSKGAQIISVVEGVDRQLPQMGTIACFIKNETEVWSTAVIKSVGEQSNGQTT